MRNPPFRRDLAWLGEPLAAAAPGADAQAMLSALPVATVLIDAEDRFRAANPAAEQFFGISIAQLRQIALTDLLAAEHPIFLLIEQVRAEEGSVSKYEIALDSPRLQKPAVTVQGAPVPEAPGSVILCFQDASAARALDRQMTFRNAARSVAGMAAILAHEVKNPLSGIRGAAQLLENVVGAADRELARLICDEADRIRALVDRMEIFSEKPIERRAVNIHRVLEHVRRVAQSGFAAHLRIHEQYDPSLPSVWGHRDQLIQVMLNLVKNAAEAITEAGQADGEITLTTAYQHGVRIAVAGSQRRVLLPLVVCVRDNGPGIPDDIRPHLFEPFVTTRSGGTGLGLALVAKIIGDHGGLIEVESRPGRTEFRAHLPVLADEDG